MIRVLVDGIIYGKQVHGGVGRVFEEVVRRISADPDSGIEFVLNLPPRIQRLPDSLAPSERLHHVQGASLEIPSGTRPLRYANSRLKSFLQGRSLRKLKSYNPKVFHSTYYTDSPISGLKNVVTVYDFIDAHTFSGMSGNPPGFIPMMRKNIEKADLVVPISESVKRDCLKFTNVSEDRLKVIHLGASDVFGMDPGEEDEIRRFRRDYRIDGPYWFYVGRRNPYKNFPALLRAWKIFRDVYKIDSWLVVTGAYGDLQRFEIDFLMAHGLENRLVMTRSVDDKRLRALYRGAAAFVFPSLYEGFGIPILEAFASRTPCIVSDIPVFREVAGEAALYFQPYDDESLAAQMNAVLSDETRESLIRGGEERLQLFSWGKAARAYAEVYRGLV